VHQVAEPSAGMGVEEDDLMSVSSVATVTDAIAFSQPQVRRIGGRRTAPAVIASAAFVFGFGTWSSPAIQVPTAVRDWHLTASREFLTHSALPARVVSLADAIARSRQILLDAEAERRALAEQESASYLSEDYLGSST
jgi:hypothetical protein